MDIAQIRQWREQGVSQQGCADKLGLSRDQLLRRARRDPALHKALRPVPGAPKTKGDRGKAGAAKNKAQAAKRKQALLEPRQAQAPPAYVDPELMAWRLAEYMQAQDTAGKPYLICGMYRALGISPSTWADYASGSKDSKTYKLIVDGIPLVSREGDTSYIISAYRDKADLYPYMHYLCTGTALPAGSEYTRQIIDQMLAGQQFCFSQIIKNALLPLHEDVESRLPRGTIGDIMRAKVILGWQDERTVTHKAEICTADEARAALEALGYKALPE